MDQDGSHRLHWVEVAVRLCRTRPQISGRSRKDRPLGGVFLNDFYRFYYKECPFYKGFFCS
jgi:hypothetical protein